jgi:hypothetical protein
VLQEPRRDATHLLSAGKANPMPLARCDNRNPDADAHLHLVRVGTNQ